MPVSSFKIILLLLIFLSSSIKAQSPLELSNLVFNYLKERKHEKVDALFDTTGILKLVAMQQQASYKSDLENLGKPKKLLKVDEEDNGFKTKTALSIQFKKEKKLLYIVFDNKKIQSFSFGKYTDTPFFQLKGYKGFSEVTDLSTNVKTRDGLTLGANIAFGDTSKSKSPLVILVHGSGPGDRDETIGPNKPFRDLAQGLAQQGIISIRYDKRTFAYQYDPKLLTDSFSLYEETINDAIDAVALARQYTFIDTTKIYIIGHSLGAMCAPKIAELCPKLKGIIMIGAPVTNLVDVLPQQAEYMALLDDTISTIEQMNINSMKWLAEKIKSPALGKTPKGLLMGGSPTYWRSILNYDQLATAKKLSLPILILGGDRDFQVLPKEFAEWQKQLGSHKNVVLKSYPKLNHLFLEGEGKPNMKDYEVPGHVPQYVIDDITQFIKGQ